MMSLSDDSTFRTLPRTRAYPNITCFAVGIRNSVGEEASGLRERAREVTVSFSTSKAVTYSQLALVKENKTLLKSVNWI